MRLEQVQDHRVTDDELAVDCLRLPRESLGQDRQIDIGRRGDDGEPDEVLATATGGSTLLAECVRLIEAAGPARSLTVTFVVPVFALFYGSVFLSEAITPWMIGCGVIILLGTSLSTGLLRLWR